MCVVCIVHCQKPLPVCHVWGYSIQVVTRDATPAAGASAGCSANVHAAFQTIFALGATQDGRDTLARSLRICEHTPVANTSSVQRLAMTMLNAWDTMAMGTVSNHIC